MSGVYLQRVFMFCNHRTSWKLRIAILLSIAAMTFAYKCNPTQNRIGCNNKIASDTTKSNYEPKTSNNIGQSQISWGSRGLIRTVRVALSPGMLHCSKKFYLFQIYLLIFTNKNVLFENYIC